MMYVNLVFLLIDKNTILMIFIFEIKTKKILFMRFAQQIVIFSFFVCW